MNTKQLKRMLNKYLRINHLSQINSSDYLEILTQACEIMEKRK